MSKKTSVTIRRKRRSPVRRAAPLLKRVAPVAARAASTVMEAPRRGERAAGPPQATLGSANGPVTLEIAFGHAQHGTYTIQLFDPTGKLALATETGLNTDERPDSFVLGMTAAALDQHLVQWSGAVDAFSAEPGQRFSVTFDVRQRGQTVPGGHIEKTGPLNVTQAFLGILRLITAALILIASLALPAAASDGGDGQDQPPSLLSKLATGKPVKLVTLDLAVPDSPALALLGLSPEKVARPGSPRDLATTALNGVDRRGNLQSGLAVDFAPLFLFGGNGITYDDYRTRWGTRLLGRTQVSVATAKGSGEADKAVRAAVGVRMTLWDSGDPRLDAGLIACMDAIPVPPPKEALLTQEAIDAWIARATAERRPLIEQCHSQFKDRRWNASSIAVGVAPEWNSSTGGWKEFDSGGAGVWTSVAIALSRTEQFETPAGTTVPVERPFGQIVVQGRYRGGELVPDRRQRGAFFEKDSAGLAGRVMIGSSNRALVVEGEFAREMPDVGEATGVFELSVGGQMKLASDVWLSLAVGGHRGGSPNEERSTFVMSSFKWALSREPSLR
jgi:hypothetical protein